MPSPSGPAALEAIIFDFDGVVVDSEPLHFQAFTKVAHESGLPFPTNFDGYRADGFIGYDDRDAFRVMQGGAPGIPLDVAKESSISRLVDRKAQVFEEMATQAPTAIPGVLALWDELDASGFPYAIASGAGRADIDMMLKGLGRHVPVIVSCDDVARSKPDPESYTLAVRRLGAHLGCILHPAQCLAIEDTPAGLRSARSAGLRTLGIPTSHDRADILMLADRVLEKPHHCTFAQLKAWNS